MPFPGTIRAALRHHHNGATGGGPTVGFAFKAATDTVTALPGYTFTRADATTCATYTDNSGVLNTVAAGVIRSAHYVSGFKTLLLEPTSTNLILQPLLLANAAWSLSSGNGPVNPTVTAGQSTDPFGTAANAASVLFPACSTTNFSNVNESPGGQGAVVKAWSGYIKGSVGGEQNYLGATPDGTNYGRVRFTATTSWARWSCATTTSNSQVAQLGTDLRDASQTSTASSTCYASAFQLENLALPTSFILSGAATATRAADALTYNVTGGGGAGTLYLLYYDFAGALQETNNQSFTAGATYTPGNLGAYRAIKFAYGTQTLATMQGL